MTAYAHSWPLVAGLNELDAPYCSRSTTSSCGDAGTTVFLVQSEVVVERVCNRTLWMNEGRIVDDGSAKEVIRE